MSGQPSKGRFLKPSDDVVEMVREELKRHKGEWGRLARLSKKHKPILTYRWIVAFASEQIDDPGFSRVRQIASFLGFRLRLEPGPHFNKFNVEE